HVPAEQIIAMSKRDDLIGIAAPGMPAGSPGMEVDGIQETYQVIGLTKAGIDQAIAGYPVN
ncbi:DUF411 domain-containing protein, partial [Streptomyces hilarionis]